MIRGLFEMYLPSVWICRLTDRPVYACSADNNCGSARVLMRSQVIDKWIYGAGLLGHVVQVLYFKHRPLYRVQQDLSVSAWKSRRPHWPICRGGGRCT